MLQKPTVSPYEPLHSWPLWIFPQQMSAGRARRAICIMVIMSSACDQARSGCAWLMHLRAHVQSMMSWRLCCLLQSIVYHLSESNKQLSFQFHPTCHNQLDLTDEYFVNCELFNDLKIKHQDLSHPSPPPRQMTCLVRRNVKRQFEKPLSESASSQMAKWFSNKYRCL